MFFERDLEKKSALQAEKIEEASNQLEQLDQKIEELLCELKVSPEQLTAFLQDNENFTEENWQQLLQQKQEMQAKLERELAQICNPAKLKQTYKSRCIPPHWLFVR